MNDSMLWRFVRKDLHFNRGLTVGSIFIGFVGLALVDLGEPGAYPAVVLLITAAILQAVFVCTRSVVAERKEKALTFALSFPISNGQYTAAKVIAAIACFLVPWAVIALGGLVLLHVSRVPHGLIPLSIVAWLFLLDEFSVILGVTLFTDSDAWVGAVIASTSISVSFFFYFVLRVSSIHATMNGPTAVWNGAVISILAAEIGVIVLIGAVVSLLLARRRDFI
jgi:ABC-type Na+ efflux pump permease subunit